MSDLEGRLRDALFGLAEWENMPPDAAPDWLITAITAVVQPEIDVITNDAVLRAEQAEAQRASSRALLEGSQRELRAAITSWGQAETERNQNAATIRDYETAICFETTCTNCAAMLNTMAAGEAERDQLKATIDHIRALHHLTEWVSLSNVCARHHWFRQVEPNPENIAVADVCADCNPRRYMCCVCGETQCEIIAALEPPEETT